MNIYMVQSLVQKTNLLAGSILIRYREMEKEDHPTIPVDREEPQLSSQDGANRMKTSCIIIRREYAYLEPVVRETFKDAADIRVLLDRRSMERRRTCGANGGTEGNRRMMADRRVSSPILDILINLNDPKPSRLEAPRELGCSNT